MPRLRARASQVREELLRHAQEAFGVNRKLHQQLLVVASEEKVGLNSAFHLCKVKFC